MCKKQKNRGEISNEMLARELLKSLTPEQKKALIKQAKKLISPDPKKTP